MKNPAGTTALAKKEPSYRIFSVSIPKDLRKDMERKLKRARPRPTISRYIADLIAADTAPEVVAK